MPLVGLNIIPAIPIVDDNHDAVFSSNPSNLNDIKAKLGQNNGASEMHYKVIQLNRLGRLKPRVVLEKYGASSRTIKIFLVIDDEDPSFFFLHQEISPITDP